MKQTDLSSALRVSNPMKSRSMTNSFTLPDGTCMEMWITLINFDSFPFFMLVRLITPLAPIILEPGTKLAPGHAGVSLGCFRFTYFVELNLMVAVDIVLSKPGSTGLQRISGGPYPCEYSAIAGVGCARRLAREISPNSSS